MSNQTANSGIVDYNSLLGGQRVIETYRILLTTEPVLEEVITNLDLPYSIRELAKHIEVHSIPDTQLLELIVEDTDPDRAAETANEVAFTFLLHQSSEKQLQFIEAQEQTILEQMDALEQSIEQNSAELEKARGSASLFTQEELAALETRQLEQRGTYAQLISSYLDIQSMQSRLLDIAVVEPALPPRQSVRPRTLLNTGVAGASGCLIAIVVTFSLEFLSDNLETPDDVRNGLGLPNLGAIPFVKFGSDVRRNGLYVQEDWGSAEAFRILRTNLEFTNVDRALQVILVTSPGPGEGKTSISANLGAVIAQDEHKVLLVDADLHKPHLHQAFHMPNHTGLTSLLRGDLNLRDCVVETSTTNLFLLPSGPTPPNPSDLLRSHRMAALIKEFRSFADTILFDSPPVTSCSDAMILGSQADGVLLVFDSRSTQRQAAVRALEALNNVNAAVLGGVLNNMDARSSKHYYYYQSNAKKRDPTLWAKLFDNIKTAQGTLRKVATSRINHRRSVPGD